MGANIQFQLTTLLYIGNLLMAVDVNGIVTDQDGRSLPGANIMVEGTNIGSASDSEGRFTFQYEPVGDFVIVASYIGYSSFRQTYQTGDDLTDLTIMLDQGKLFGQMVVVTARKREETIKEVPVSMVSIREETIRDMGASSLGDLTAVVPNVFVYDGESGTEFNIRGIAGGARNPGMATAEGVYLDGVIMGRPSFIATDVMDMSSVEFLRGPQGTLFGRNTVSGAVNLVTVKPTPINGGSFLAESGELGYLKLNGSVNYRLTDKIYSRLSVYSFDYNGYLTNTFDNSPEKYKNNIGGRLALRALPTEKLTLDLSMDYYTEDQNQMGGHVSDWRISTSSGGLYNNLPLDSIYLVMDSVDIRDGGIYSYNHDTTGYASRDLRGLTLTSNYRLGKKLNLVTILSYRKSISKWFNDEDGMGLHLMTGKWKDYGEQSTFELRLVSSSQSRLSWLSGFFYYNLFNSLPGPIYPTPLFIHFITGLPMFVLEQQFADAMVKPVGKGNTASIGAYTSVDYQVSDKITVTLGARYSLDKIHFKYRQEGLPTFGYVHIPADSNGNLIDGYFDSTKTWAAITPTLNIKYVLSQNINLFGTVSRGYKSGGFNTDYVASFESVATPFRPELITNYEAGFKAGNQANTLFINSALYRMEYDDMQVSQFQDLFEGYTISNAASSTISGFELDFSFRMLNNALTLIGGYGRTKAVFNEFHDGYFNGYWDEGEDYTDENENGQYDAGERFTDEDNDFSGQHISLYPKESWNLMADFRLPFSEGEIFVVQIRGDFLDEKLAQLSTDKDLNLLRDDARTLVDGHFGVESERWGIFAWVENLLNVKYIVNQGANGYLGFIEQLWGQPRLVGLRFTYKF